MATALPQSPALKSALPSSLSPTARATASASAAAGGEEDGDVGWTADTAVGEIASGTVVCIARGGGDVGGGAVAAAAAGWVGGRSGERSGSQYTAAISETETGASQ